MKKQLEINKIYHSGFSIVELSIVLTIIAFIATSALAVGASRVEAARVNSTNDRMDFIMKAFDLFVKRYGYLPCPADNDLPTTDADFGNGVGSGNPGPCAAANYTDTVSSPATNVVIGGLPTQQLNISPSLAVDGWSRRFTYIMDQDLSVTSATVPLGWSDPGVVGEIVVKNTASGGIDLTTEAVMVLISHGTNGFGAWKGKGGGQLGTCSSVADLDERENMIFSGGGGCPEDANFVQKFRTSTFDDIIEYRVKWQFDAPYMF